MADSELPASGGGWPLIEGWARATLSPEGPRLWQTLNHQSACLSCAWGTGGQNGGFRDELGEPLQRCLKSVEAIQAELQPAVPAEVFAGRTLAELQQLSSAECDRLGRLDRPLIRREGSDHYEPIGWKEVHALTAEAFRTPAPERVASYSSGRSSNEAAYLLQLLLRALGSNAPANHPRLMNELIRLRERGGTVIVINPVRSAVGPR